MDILFTLIKCRQWAWLPKSNKTMSSVNQISTSHPHPELLPHSLHLFSYGYFYHLPFLHYKIKFQAKPLTMFHFLQIFETWILLKRENKSLGYLKKYSLHWILKKKTYRVLTVSRRQIFLEIHEKGWFLRNFIHMATGHKQPHNMVPMLELEASSHSKQFSEINYMVSLRSATTSSDLYSAVKNA